MQKQIKDLKAAATNTGGTKRKAEEGEGGSLSRSSPAKKNLVTSDDSDDDVQCLMIASNISKEVEIKEALRMMITKPAKVDLEEKITSEPNPVKVLVKCQVEKEAILNLDEVKLKAIVGAKKSMIDTDKTDTKDLDADVQEINPASEVKVDVENKVNPATAMESKSSDEATIVLEMKDVNLEISWQLKKWPSLPSLLNRSIASPWFLIELRIKLGQLLKATHFAGNRVSISPFLLGLQTPGFRTSSTYPLHPLQGGY